MANLVHLWKGLVLLIICCAGPVQAQGNWTPIGPPAITNFNIQTVGGITYFTHISSVENCRRVSSQPVSRFGTNLLLTINEEEWSGICGFDFDTHSETHVSVLGALPPGQYLMQLSSVQFGNPTPSPFAYVDVIVPISNTPTVQLTLETNQVTLAVAGIANVTYKVQTSTTLTNWVTLSTNVGGPFVWSQPVMPGPEPSRAYRVEILGN